DVDARNRNALSRRLKCENSTSSRSKIATKEYRPIASIYNAEEAEWPAVATATVIDGAWRGAWSRRAASTCARVHRAGADTITFEPEDAGSRQGDVADNLLRVIRDQVKDVIIAGIIGCVGAGDESPG